MAGAGKDRDPDTEASVWFWRTVVGAVAFSFVVFYFILR